MEHIIGKLLQDFEEGKMNRRQLIQSLALAAGAAAPIAAADNKGFKAVSVNHISYVVADLRVKTITFAFGIRQPNNALPSAKTTRTREPRIFPAKRRLWSSIPR